MRNISPNLNLATTDGVTTESVTEKSPTETHLENALFLHHATIKQEQALILSLVCLH